ncbi:MAG TPA: glycosyltransferase family 2 protein [Actinoplanes sp.]|nr:glycosyltransferase family 2 protein [Actinoplanes sp.]
MDSTPLDTTIVIPTHTEDRWSSLVRTIACAMSQQAAPAEVVVVVDHNPALFHRIERELPGVIVLENAFAKGVSGNRNTGAFHAKTALVAFMDDDITAGPEWLGRLIEPFSDPRVVGTGGGIIPAWEREKAPSWMPEEFLWAVGGSYAGMPTETSPIRNVWSASMVVRRQIFDAVGGFRVGFGKLGDRNRPEDTELCLRMSAYDGGQWMYVPGAMIRHEVPANRSTFPWFVKRCYAEGRGKVQMAGLDQGGSDTLGTERSYLWSLPKAAVRNLATGRFGKAGGIVAGVAAAGWGGVVETVAAKRAPKTDQPLEAAR